MRESLAFLMRVSSTAGLSSGLRIGNSLLPVFLLFFHSTNTVSADHAAGVGLGPGRSWESSGRQNAVSTILGPRAQWRRQEAKPLLSNVDGRDGGSRGAVGAWGWGTDPGLGIREGL